MFKRTIVIGGGIAGLTAAWRLFEAGLPVTLLEQSGSVGGCIKTLNEQGYLLELGPNTFLNSSSELWDLAKSAGILDLKIETPEKIGKKRYIFKNDRLMAVPAGPNILFSPILSARGRFRLLAEPFIKSKHARSSTNAYADESLASFVKRRLGDEVLNYLVTPFVSGIFAGDPERLSVKAIFPKLAEAEKKFGSIFKGMSSLKSEIKSSGLGSFIAGIGTLPLAIESRLKDSIIKNAVVQEISRLNNGYNIRYAVDGELKNIVADTVICALPAYAAAEVLANIDLNLKKSLQEIEYAPIIVIHTGYKISDIARKLNGFGFLVPRKQRARILGSLWSSTLFKDRSPEGSALFTSFMGGMLDLEALDLNNDDIMRIVQKDMARTLNIKTNPNFACITRYTHAIPQYNLGHLNRINNIEGLHKKYRGLFLTGSYFTGISVAGTIEHANKVANEIMGGNRL
jgi:oxygen-dependent protoporphyrinogen oxidase